MIYVVANIWLCKKISLIHLDEKNRKYWAVGDFTF